MADVVDDLNAERTFVEGRDLKSGRFLPGNSGNGGRPKGSRNKLGERFVTDLYDRWKQSGASALERMAAEDPSGFVRVVAQLMPKEIDATLNVDIDLFANASNFAEAYRLARKVLTEPALIEADDVD